jgi:hypothetical protein
MNPQIFKAAIERRAAIAVVVVLISAVIGIAVSLYTRWFIPVSLCLPVISAVTAIAVCLQSGMSPRCVWVLAAIAFGLPAICSWVCWRLLLYNFIT